MSVSLSPSTVASLLIARALASLMPAPLACLLACLLASALRPLGLPGWLFRAPRHSLALFAPLRLWRTSHTVQAERARDTGVHVHIRDMDSSEDVSPQRLEPGARLCMLAGSGEGLHTTKSRPLGRRCSSNTVVCIVSGPWLHASLSSRELADCVDNQGRAGQSSRFGFCLRGAETGTGTMVRWDAGTLVRKPPRAIIQQLHPPRLATIRPPQQDCSQLQTSPGAALASVAPSGRRIHGCTLRAGNRAGSELASGRFVRPCTMHQYLTQAGVQSAGSTSVLHCHG